MQNSSPSGILYAEDFDAADAPVTASPVAPPPSPDPVVLEPTYSLADLNRAAEDADRKARAHERREAAETQGVLKSKALGRIAEELQLVRSESARLAAVAASSTADTVLAMVAAALPAFSTAHGTQEASALIRLLLPEMTHQSHLAIRAHPSMVEILRTELAPAFEESQTTVEWFASASMQLGDLNVRWQDGMMIRDAQALCARICAIVMPELSSTHTEPEIQDV